MYWYCKNNAISKKLSENHVEYRVVIAAQDQAEETIIETLLPAMQQTALAGGTGYLVGTYYSQKYADLVCDQHRSLGFFTINMPSVEHNEPTA